MGKMKDAASLDSDLCEKCGKQYLMVEYAYDNPCFYDGISELWCEPCGIRIGRWTGRVLGKGDCEPRYGGTHHPKCPQAKP